jgi:hypothetical protein
LSSAVNWKAPHFILLLENKSVTAETLNLKNIQHFYPTLLKTELPSTVEIPIPGIICRVPGNC